MAALALVVWLSPACSSGPMSHERTANLGSQFSAIAANLDTLKHQVDASLKSLETLMKDGGSNAKSAYQTIAGSATDLAPAISLLTNQLSTSQIEGKHHFDTWSQENTTIQDAQLKARAVEREGELSALLNTASTSVSKALGMSQSYQQALQDLQRYLRNDLSPTAIGNAADLIARTSGDGGRCIAALESARQDALHFAAKVGG